MAKLQPAYRGPFAHPGFFETVSRREAAQLMRQWRANGTVVSTSRPNDTCCRRLYRFRGEHGESAALSLYDPR